MVKNDGTRKWVSMIFEIQRLALAVFKYIGCNNILKSNKIIGFKLHHKRYFTVDSNNDNLIVLRHIEHRLRKSSQPCFAPGIQ